jgi:hypothetical protein
MTSLKYLSPKSIVVVSVLLLFSFTLVPPAIYEKAINEPNLMFGNIVLYIFLIINMLLIFLGSRLATYVPSIKMRSLKAKLQISPFIFVMIPSFVATIFLGLTVSIVLKQDSSVLMMLMSGEGQSIKRALDDAGKGALNGSLPLGMGMAWWAVDAYFMLRGKISKIQKSLMILVIFILLSSLISAAFMMMARFVLMPTLFGVFIITLRHQSEASRMKFMGLVGRSLFFAVTIITIFLIFSYIRGNTEKDSILMNVIGYGPASLNHLAALLDGKINAESLKDTLLVSNFGFIFKFPFLTHVFSNLTSMYEDARNSWFAVTWASGLNGAYIWITLFGDVYAGLNFVAVPYLIVYGFVFGRAWRGFSGGKTFGIMIYPWAAFNILFAFGSNFFASNFLSILIILSLILWCYGSIIKPRVIDNVSPRGMVK